MRPLRFFLILTLFSPGLSFGASGGVEGEVEYRGESVSGAYVEIFDTRKTDSEAVDSTNTGSDGRFYVSLPPGSYRLTVKKRPEGPGSGGMLFGSTGGNPLLVDSRMVLIPTVKLRDMGVGEENAGEITVSGSVRGPRGPLPGAYVYFYPGKTRRGPGYLARARTREKGRFKAGLTPGAYTVTVRFGAPGDGIGGNGMGTDGMGTVNVGDLVGDYRSNPLHVGNVPVDLGSIELRVVDPDTWEQKQWAGVQGSFIVMGLVVREDRSPMEGAYVFLYDDRRMVGKPVSISAPTGKDGKYTVTVSQPGEYYIGARTRFGGPVEPGEFMGAWDEKGPRPVTLEGDALSAKFDIVVREVW